MGCVQKSFVLIILSMTVFCNLALKRPEAKSASVSKNRAASRDLRALSGLQKMHIKARGKGLYFLSESSQITKAVFQRCSGANLRRKSLHVVAVN